MRFSHLSEKPCQEESEGIFPLMLSLQKYSVIQYRVWPARGGSVSGLRPSSEKPVKRILWLSA
jgi:hypothetical protein